MNKTIMLLEMDMKVNRNEQRWDFVVHFMGHGTWGNRSVMTSFSRGLFWAHKKESQGVEIKITLFSSFEKLLAFDHPLYKFPKPR